MRLDKEEVMNNLIYHFKPYIIFVLGFLSGNLDHPAKWLAVVSFIAASIVIEFWRYQYRKVDYEQIEIKGLNNGNF